MRATLRRMLAILDGTPTGARGQSLVELTLTLPILMVMLMGLTEIGWYANNFLTLLDVVREAGRFGATKDPTEWSDGQELNYSRMDCEEDSSRFDKLAENNPTWPGPDLSAYPTLLSYQYADYGERPGGFYDAVACTVIRNMAPLEFDDQTDDVIVSVFSFFVINRGTTSAEVRIFGRYPARTNECEIDDVYDPFDWNHNSSGSDIDEDAAYFDSGSDNVRGYVFRGNISHDYGASVPCLGSTFSTADVETMLNFDGNSDQERKLEQAANYGLVLVEVYWEHHQLLGLPWFNFGPLEDAMLIHVWAFFPVSAAEPDLDY
ncbi:MAG: pilus assembly protein [Anaerolineae bacterium]|nr:pilus assembly protein [Anaerolineae bacterium]